MSHIMLDLETLGVRPGCKILSIGACAFHHQWGLGNTFYREIKRDFQGQLHEDPDTLIWWNKQNPTVRDATLNDAEHKVMILEALIDFAEWLKPMGNVWMWGNGADFDNVIIAEVYRVFGLPLPWGKFNNRCYRTLKSSFPGVKSPEFIGTKHNALDDAKHQARHAVQILKVAKEKGIL